MPTRSEYLYEVTKFAQRDRIIEGREGGLSWRCIARETGLSQGRIREIYLAEQIRRAKDTRLMDQA